MLCLEVDKIARARYQIEGSRRIETLGRSAAARDVSCNIPTGHHHFCSGLEAVVNGSLRRHQQD